MAVSAPAQQSPAANSNATSPAAAKPAGGTTAAHSSATKPGAHTAAKPKAAPLPLTTQTQKASYAIGMGLGANLHRDSVEIDTAALLRGLKDGLAGSKSLHTDEEAKAAITQLQAEVRAREAEKLKVEALENKMKGDTFLSANKAKEGVVTLPSGLQYKVLQAGTGPKPTAEDVVVCNYRGTLVDGTEFDSSYKRGEPIKIPVKEVIKGWTEAIQLMPVGSKWQIYIPSNLAYGERGAPGSPIGPNSTLIFDVELLSIEPKPAPKAAVPSNTEGAGKEPAQPQQKEQPKEQPKEQTPPTPQPKP